MLEEYQAVVDNVCTKCLSGVVEAQHLPPNSNFVWRAFGENKTYIVKLNPRRPYRLRREIEAYRLIERSSLNHAKIIAHGELSGIPYLILSDCGSKSVADLVLDVVSPKSLQAVFQTIQELTRFAEQDYSDFGVIRDGLTTRDRDIERLTDTCARFAPLTRECGSILSRIESHVHDAYTDMCHRDLSPRQVVLDGEKTTLTDFESIGPGQFERDVGDLLGGIAKYGEWSDEYFTEAIRSAAASRPNKKVDSTRIADYAAYSCFWPTGTTRDAKTRDRYLGIALTLFALGEMG